MSNQTNELETLKNRSLELVNAARVAFGKEPIPAFVAGFADEDRDCVIDAIEDATDLSLDWGELDNEDKHWLVVWDEESDSEERMNKLAQVWHTATRREFNQLNIEIPALLAEFAGRVALDGDYPELVKE